MKLGPDGLFLVKRLEGLTGSVFETLMEQGEPFTLKVDYRGLPPPLEELDLAQLVAARPSALPPGTLVLRRVSDWFEFCRIAPGRHASHEDDRMVARVVVVERPGVLIRLDSAWWQSVGSLLVKCPGFPPIYDRWGRLRSLIGKLVSPFPCPVNLGPPERLAQGVIQKCSYPDDVQHQVKSSVGGLEVWEEEFFGHVWRRPARLLVVGCGAGREAIALTQYGFSVVGIDVIPGLIAAAREQAELRGVQVVFEVKAPHDLAYPAQSFDAVLCSQRVYNLTPTRRRRIELLRGLERLMTPDGILVLWAGWYRDRGPRLALVDGLRWLLRKTLGERFSTEPGDRLVRHLSLASDARDQYFYHVFQSHEEIRQEIVAAGLIGEMDPDGAWIIRKAG